jgi:CHAT domain-containing protein
VSYLPAATALLRPPSGAAAAGSLLVVAPSRSGLRHAPEEARAIGAMFQPHSQALIGGDATEGRFKELAGGFRMLHLATHGHFNEANPVLSGLEFETDPDDDGMLRVHEILDLQLRADLVTLSACDTALGTGYFTRLPRGEEFVGLNRAFLAAGSASVMATLWQVDDRASFSMMKQFYRRLNASQDGSGAAGALAYAQRAHRRSGALGHPYYWAAYVVVGQGSQAMGAGGMYSGRRS